MGSTDDQTAVYSKLTEQLESLAKNVPEAIKTDEPGRQRLLDALRYLSDQIETPGDTTKRLLYSACELAGTKIGVDLHVYNILAEAKEPVTTAEIAAKNNDADEALLTRLLKYMASIHLIEEVDVDKWAASNITYNLAKRGVTAGVNHNYHDVSPAWLQLSKWLKKKNYRLDESKEDTAFIDAQGDMLFPWYEKHPENAKEFNIFMTSHRTNAKTWLDVLDVKQEFAFTNSKDAVNFVDVGGGIGHVCAAFKKQLPDLPGRVVLEDQPSVVKQALPTPGVEPVPVDFFTEQPIKAADIYYFRSIFCDWPDSACRAILRQTHAAVADHSTVVIDETVVRDKGAGRVEMQHDMVMLSVMNSEARTETRFRNLLGEEGFEIRKIVFPVEGHRQGIIIAKKK